MFHLDMTWLFFKEKRLKFFCKFLKKLFHEVGPTVPHSREALQQTVNIPQTSIIPPLTVLLSVESLPIKKKKKTQKQKNLQFSKLFCQSLTLKSGLLWADNNLTWCGPPVMRKYFDIINFSRRHNFTLCLCHVFSRTSYHSGGSCVS